MLLTLVLYISGTLSITFLLPASSSRIFLPLKLGSMPVQSKHCRVLADYTLSCFYDSREIHGFGWLTKIRTAFNLDLDLQRSIVGEVTHYDVASVGSASLT